jgi:hypothetical protein
MDAGTGIVIQNTSGQFTFYRSIITDAYRESHSPHVQGVYFSGLRDSRLRIEESILMRNGFGFGDPMTNWPPSGQQYYDIFNDATRSNSIHDNIFDSGAAYRAVLVTDGVAGDSAGCSTWTYPGITGNRVDNNILINANGVAWENRPEETAAGTTNDTVFADNTMYASRAEAAAAEGWSGPDRTLKTYLESLGLEVTSDDGFIEFFTLARQQRKGNWQTAFTSEELNQYIRAGF